MILAIHIKEEGGYKGVFASRDIVKGLVLCDLTHGWLVKEPTRTSIQNSETIHVEHEIGGCINHSCHPSCRISSFFVVALRDIKEGEEITFDYNKNEDVIASPFECNCCGKMILGRKHEQERTKSNILQ